MAVSFSVSDDARAPKELVWKVLSDFSNVASYTDRIKTSASTSGEATGSGATRHCDLAPFGTTEEKILEYVPNERMRVSIYETTGIPVKSSETTFEVEHIDAQASRLTMTAEVQPKGGPFAGLIGRRLQKRLPKGSESLIRDLASSAEKMASATPDPSSVKPS